MIITVFGATGIVGKQLVKQALFKGYTVKAFGRNVFTAGFPENDLLQLIQGALFDEDQVFHAIQGSDAVLSVLGGAFDGADKSRSLGMKIITKEMEHAGIKRIVALGGKGVLNSPDDDIIMNAAGYPVEFLPVGKEHYKAYEYLKGSSLKWTFVCSPDIINAEATGLYHTAANYPPVPDNNKINAGDLAIFMLNELLKNAYINQRVGISN
jgi:putative NADH-flavin reductase